MSTPKISIVILNWNGWQDTLECFESLTKINYSNYEVIVVDNKSANESVEKISSWIKNRTTPVEYRLILNDRNAGFAGGNNPGIKYALKNNSDYVLLLNNDTLVDPNFLADLVKIGESDRKFGIIGPKIYYESDKKRIWFGGGKFSWLGGGSHIDFDKIDDEIGNNKTKETEFMTGCCLLIKSAVIKKIGLMNEDFFLYYEDTEWSLRARKFGYKIIYVPAAHVWHKVSRSVKPKTNPVVHYYHIRNALLLSKLHAPFYALFFIYFWGIVKYFKQPIKILIFPEKKDIANMIMLGVKDFYSGKFGIYQSKIQKLQ